MSMGLFPRTFNRLSKTQVLAGERMRDSKAKNLQAAFFAVCALTLGAPRAFSEGKHPPKSPVTQGTKPSGGEQKAHEHGQARIQIAVQGLEIVVRMEAPAEAIFGFEHKPKSEKEKTIVHDIEKKLKTDLPNILGIEGSLGCHFDKLDIQHGLEDHQADKGDGHADFDLDAKATCSKSPVGTKLKVVFLKEFKRIKKLKLEVLSGEKVSSQVVTKSVQEVQI